MDDSRFADEVTDCVSSCGWLSARSAAPSHELNKTELLIHKTGVWWWKDYVYTWATSGVGMVETLHTDYCIGVIFQINGLLPFLCCFSSRDENTWHERKGDSSTGKPSSLRLGLSLFNREDYLLCLLLLHVMRMKESRKLTDKESIICNVQW